MTLPLAVSFKVELYCQQLLCSETTSISFPSLPGGFEEIKNTIEEECSIPSFAQTIWIEGNRIEPSPSNTPASFYLQSGDTIKITYPIKCDCKLIKEAILWLTKSIEVIQKVKESKNEETVMSLYRQSETFFNEHQPMSALVDDLFIPWIEPSKQMNSLYFDSIGGLTLLTKLHAEMSSLRESALFRVFHSLSEWVESYCCAAIGNFASETMFRRRVTECGGLDRCLSTLMAHPADDERHSHMFNSALFSVCNLSDIPENQIFLSRKWEVISQVLPVIGSHHHFRNQNTSVAVALLGNIAQSKETHQNIFKDDFVNKVIENVMSHQYGAEMPNGETHKTIIKYYTGIMMSQMILGSAHLLENMTSHTLQTMVGLFMQILQVDPMKIGRYEKDNGTTWGSFLPLVYLYEPSIDFAKCYSNCSLMSHLYQLSTDFILHTLESTLWRKEHIEVLLDEQLLDYVIMLPWFVPQQSKSRSVSVVNEVAKNHQVQPPPLTTICKGKISKMTLGLYEILKMKSISEFTEIFNA